MWELDYKESWAQKNWCFQTVVPEKTFESPLGSEEISPEYSLEAETPILWSTDEKNWLIGKGPDAGKDWGQEEKGMTQGKMVGWHHQLNGHEFEQILGDSKG